MDFVYFCPEVFSAHHLFPGYGVALAGDGGVHQVHHPSLLLVTQRRRPGREVRRGGHHRNLDLNLSFMHCSPLGHLAATDSPSSFARRSAGTFAGPSASDRPLAAPSLARPALAVAPPVSSLQLASFRGSLLRGSAEDRGRNRFADGEYSPTCSHLIS